MRYTHLYNNIIIIHTHLKQTEEKTSRASLVVNINIILLCVGTVDVIKSVAIEIGEYTVCYGVGGKSVCLQPARKFQDENCKKRFTAPSEQSEFRDGCDVIWE